ncbi:hypothetical protein [Burkholderia multivorans]|uniref:hypothetical protein n=1 Tax=Burkholderia multivorans TaxID=87883 RepID=UPI001C2389C2|nr:hypothetical protein [Burkholderia multivorans]MBU9212403.1 hypothetical protein [Burkholderia multivorans]MBU9336691.1 hypothetical protein [Burkholderia multivorans]MBU9444538.1 hypothetical protein [Burkholderia multivorans]MCA8480195.1 hypothetical protein [Burkholderia multivorans]
MRLKTTLMGFLFAAVSFHGVAAVAASDSNDWHQHKPEKISSVASRLAGAGWTINWQAGTDPVITNIDGGYK